MRAHSIIIMSCSWIIFYVSSSKA